MFLCLIFAGIKFRGCPDAEKNSKNLKRKSEIEFNNNNSFEKMKEE